MPELKEIYNFLPLSDTLLTSGQPTEAQYPAIAAAGVQAVVNLALASSDNALPDEAGLAGSLGLDYVHIPILWDNPTDENFERFVTAMDSLQNRKVLVHCAANMRATAFVALYRIRRLGWDHAQAFKDVYPIWDPYAEATWGKFVRRILDGK
jgi:protein tyrosine phosphatase (PTP) superfamily phosphohydrolase (DUF442 family)